MSSRIMDTAIINRITESPVRALLRRWHEARRRKARFAALERDRKAGYGDPDATGHVEMPLSALRPGEYGHILSLCADCEARQHLLELGFTTGTAVEFVRVAPLGDPITIRIRGYQLSLRRREAQAVWMRRCPPEIETPETAASAQGE